MTINLASLSWATLSGLAISLTLALIYLFLKDRDSRKIMVALGLFPSAFSFLYLAANIPPISLPENTVFNSIFHWGTIPILISIFFVLVDRLFYRRKDFRMVFLLFAFFYVFSLFLILSNSISSTLYLQSIQIGALADILLGVFLVIKIQNYSSVFFLLAICIFTLGGFSLNNYIHEPAGFSSTVLALSCFFLGYIFLGLIFGFNKFPQEKKGEGIEIYFSLENKLKQVEKALAESQQQYRWVVDNLHQGIFISDHDGKIIYTNKLFTEMLGYVPSEVMGRAFFEFIDDDSHPLMDKALYEPTNKPDEGYEINLIKKDRTRISTRISTTPFIDENNTNGVMIAVQDVTTRKKIDDELHEKINQLQKNDLATLNIMEDLQETIINLQKAKEEINQKNEELQTMNEELNVTRDQLSILNQDLEKKVRDRTVEVEVLLKQKDDFINQLGHDLKTPLTPLTTLLPLIKQGENNPRSLEILDICISNVYFMKNLVGRTLELARLNSSTFFVIGDTSLVDEINEVVNRKQSMLTEKHVTINNNIPKQLMVQADSVAMKELFDNIIVNAIKYSMPSEKIQIVIDAKEQENQVVVSVKDNGIGMSAEQLNHIFHEFYKADSSRHNLESTGLGLSICKRIIEKHGGKIWAESPGLGKGSTFYFSLPATKKKDN